MFLTVLIHIHIFIVLSVLYTVLYIYKESRIPVGASEPWYSIIPVHVICLLIDFHIYMCALIINSIQFNSMCVGLPTINGRTT